MEYLYHEMANVFPLIDGNDFAALVADVAANGLHDPIWLYEDKILDGRNRYRACIEAKIEPTFRWYDGPDPLGFVLSANLHRRHLTPSQRAIVALNILPFYEARAAERKAETEGRPTKDEQETGAKISAGLEPEDDPKEKAADKKMASDDAGKAVGVSGAYVRAAKKLAADAPDLAPLVATGEMTLQDAKREVRKRNLRESEKMATEVAPVRAVVTRAAALEWLGQQEPCDLLLTDPPYSTDVDDIKSFAAWLPDALALVKPTGRAYVFVGAYPAELQAYMSIAMPTQILVWTYNNTMGPCPKDRYKQNWQAILYYAMPEAPPLNTDRLTEMFSSQTHNAPDGRLGDRWHSWQKPLELGRMLVRHATIEGDTVLDPFVGTGTFVLAAAGLGRVAYGCDISEDTLGIAVERGCSRV